jgi:hypothetical protein
MPPNAIGDYKQHFSVLETRPFFERAINRIGVFIALSYVPNV